MDEEDKVAAIIGLQQDLAALSETQLVNIEKLSRDLDAHVEAFRNLLDMKGRADTSRAALNTGMANTSPQYKS